MPFGPVLRKLGIFFAELVQKTYSNDKIDAISILTYSFVVFVSQI